MGEASDIKKVLIAGAGPVGLFVALQLARANIRSEIFEKSNELQTGPRAAGHYGPDLEVMKRAGMYEIFAKAAHFQDGLVFRAPPVDDGKGGKTFGRDIATIREPQLTLPQSTMVPLLATEIAKTGLVKIHFGKEVIGIKQDENLVILSTKDSKTGEVEQIKGEYLVGTDGGRSVVRSLLGIGFPGHTWKERIIATNVTLKNEALAPTGSHLVVHPVKWGVVIPLEEARLGEKSLWRYAIAVDSKDTRPDEELMTDENIIASYDYLMAGSRPIQCKIEARAVYHIHQRLASTLRRGRVLLAGDAAHLCNPLGAMGLTSGILDSEALSDALIMVINEGCSDQVLTLYSDLRRQVFGLFVDPMSTQNKYRIQNNADDLERDDGFVRLLNRPGTQAMDMMRKLYEEQWRTDIRSKFAQRGAPH
ncbi:FAD binding domain protein [Pyrenochaeta sp. MPI-SDFR-AT-0127]|nr:FAD binding domain protein [Pyrenochaeta sp. MPI-SDFR-AT-0127]